MVSVSRVRVLVKVVLLLGALAALVVAAGMKGLYLKGEPAVIHMEAAADGDWRPKYFLIAAATAAGSHALVILGMLSALLTGEYYHWVGRLVAFFWGLSILGSVALFGGELVLYYASFGASLSDYKAVADLSPCIALVPAAALLQGLFLHHINIVNAARDEYVTVH
eukprot:TRINITY_DN7036_c1_g1_i1.p1 TRINITY_DN7036_c1_g1~~TRINITY_DN7036_c1_g1_i1.p1  ORF type:complete len:166 (+),score=63.27 TRINITY_DN7036_c1_g1_i1:75-572(+)